MRFLELISLFAATFAVAVASSSTPPDGICLQGAQRCLKTDVQECDRGEFKTIKQCTEFEVCAIIDTRTHYHAKCVPRSLPSTLCPVRTKRSERVAGPDTCPTVGEERCVARGRKNLIEKFSQDSQWVVEKVCPNSGTCIEYKGWALCQVPATPTSTPIAPEPCTLGERTCDNSYYTLLKCGNDKVFHTEQKCMMPGDCKIDGQGQAHCEREGMDPPKAKHIEPLCNPGHSACDHEGWHVFHCDEAGQWQLFEQCAYEGACRNSTKSKQPSCTTDVPPNRKSGCPDWTFQSCEIGVYQECKGESDMTPEMCQERMCTGYYGTVCGTCQRCQYKPKYGNIPTPEPFNATYRNCNVG